VSKVAHILAADVGGTKVLLRLVAVQSGRCEVVREQRFDSAAFADFEALLAVFLQAAPRLSAACFGVPGPVHDNAAKLTNLPWFVDGLRISQLFQIPQVLLVNDFVAIGHGIGTLAPDDLVVLQTGQPLAGAARAVLGAGTGLGVGFVFACGQHDMVVPTEGGNVDFAPNDALEMELLRYLQSRFGHVCVERVVSGPGLANIYAFMCERSQLPATLLNCEDAPAAVATAAISGSDAMAEQALELFLRCYGAFAGNLALLSLAHGGVYVAGGIAAKLLSQLQRGTFMRGFLNKGRYRGLLEMIPVYAVTEARVGLQGAQQLALRLVDV
jgi:glucokinase